jgi:hypothetical protein
MLTVAADSRIFGVSSAAGRATVPSDSRVSTVSTDQRMELVT